MYYTQSSPELYGMRCVKYIRCSHEDQVQHGDTLEAQDEILDDFIKKNKLVLVDTFVDEALTARKRFTQRKEFVRLLEGVRRHDFDIILFTKLDRWFRNIGDYHKIQEILEANNVQWKAVTESYDTTTTNGRLHINIRLSVAQDECDRDSDRIKDVFAYKLRNKSYISGNLPRGLMLDAEKHIVPDPEWKQLALDMFDIFEATNSKRKTVVLLNEKYGLRLTYEIIANSLRNPLYKGQYRDDPEFCEPLIAPERFDRLLIAGKHDARQRGSGITYIFSGLLICSDCMCRMAGLTSQYKSIDGITKKFPRYRCKTHYQSHTCPRNGSFSEVYIEKYLLERIRPALADYIAEYEVKNSASERRPEADAARIKAKMKKLYDLFMDDLIEKSMYRIEYDKLRAQLEEAQAAISVPKKDVSALRDFLARPWEEVYQTFNPEEKARFWRSILQSAVVHADGTIDLNFL